MWLDRIAGHSHTTTAAAHNNSPSRSVSTQIPARTHNDSTTSLLSLKREKKSPPDIDDPLDVLNAILQKNSNSNADVVISTPVALDAKPDLVRDVHFDGKSLEEFLEDDQEEQHADKPLPLRYSQQPFEAEKNRFQDLHAAITGCDNVSRSVELYLGDFQRELGAVSSEIESLQARSMQLNAMLDNRRNVERLLGPAVEEISVSPKAVRIIVEGPIDFNWVRTLNDVDARTTNIEAKSGVKGAEDVRPLLSDIKKKVYSHQYCCLLGYLPIYCAPGSRTYSRLSRRPDTISPVTKYQRPNPPTTHGQIERPLRLPPSITSCPYPTNHPGIRQHHALVLPVQLFSLPAGPGKGQSLSQRPPH